MYVLYLLFHRRKTCDADAYHLEPGIEGERTQPAYVRAFKATQMSAKRGPSL